MGAATVQPSAFTAEWVIRAGHSEDNGLPRCHRAVTLDQPARVDTVDT
jgi:hypothetical protein